MKAQLRHISISHRTASVSARQPFHLSDADRVAFILALQAEYPDIRGVLLLVTCNRTELYAEAESTPASELLHFLIRHRLGHPAPKYKRSFVGSDHTLESTRHLLRVAAGLESAVLGDAEIIHQIKKAYRLSREHGLQGSLLERAMQTVFRYHKRISNETAFRDGTTSTAYQALRLVRQTFGPNPDGVRILLVGAGDIARQLLQYNQKFGYRELYITNRTASRAAGLAADFRVHTFPWDRLQSGSLGDFDVIIGAAAQCPGLVTSGWNTRKKVLLLDLAVPHNIALPEENDPARWIHYDLDAISGQLQANQVHRQAAVTTVEGLLEPILGEFGNWVENAPARALLNLQKANLRKEVSAYYQQKGIIPEPAQVELAANRLLRKWRKQKNTAVHSSGAARIIEIHEALMLL